MNKISNEENISLEKIFATYKGTSDELIPVLQEVQKNFGCLSEANMSAIAEFVKVPESRVYSVATFYAQFRFSPIGLNHIMVCRGTACHVKGASGILEAVKKHGIEEGKTSCDGKFSLETVACIGACGLAPTMVINDKTHGKLTKKRVSEILNAFHSNVGGTGDD